MLEEQKQRLDSMQVARNLIIFNYSGEDMFAQYLYDFMLEFSRLSNQTIEWASFGNGSFWDLARWHYLNFWDDQYFQGGRKENLELFWNNLGTPFLSSFPKVIYEQSGMQSYVKDVISSYKFHKQLKEDFDAIGNRNKHRDKEDWQYWPILLRSGEEWPNDPIKTYGFTFPTKSDSLIYVKYRKLRGSNHNYRLDTRDQQFGWWLRRYFEGNMDLIYQIAVEIEDYYKDKI